ncbi:hypothetical protein D9M73_275140 [compost metagenome]
MTTFCWLPPEREEARFSAEGVRTSNSATRDAAFFATSAGRMEMPLAKGALS